MKRAIPFHSYAVWPPGWLIALFVVVYGVLEGGLWLIDHAVPNAAGVIADMPEIRNLRAAILVGAAVVYAVFRLCRFHPACNPAYAAWLKLSPWTADKPLPLGPVHPVWQDAVPLGILTALAAWHAQVHPALPVAAFSLVYLGGLTLLLMLTRQWWSCLVLGFLWPALFLPRTGGLPAIALVLALVVVLWHGHRNSLRAFPWEFLGSSNPSPSSPLQVEIRIPGLSGASATRTPLHVGWPFTALAPKVQCPSVSTFTSFCLSALVGWWSFCLIELLPTTPPPALLLCFGVMASALRLAIYCSGLAPSFNLWGRIGSGRLLVPGFDRVFLTPLIAVLVAIAGAVLTRLSGSWYPVAESCTLAAIWFVLFSGGPTLQNWVLTGQHRFRLPPRVNANRQQLRSI